MVDLHKNTSFGEAGRDGLWLLAILLLIAGTFAFLEWQAWRDVRSEISGDLDNLAQGTARTLQQSLARTQDDLMFFTRHLDAADFRKDGGGARRAAQLQLWSDHLSGFPDLRGFRLLNAEGDVVLSTPGLAPLAETGAGAPSPRAGAHPPRRMQMSDVRMDGGADAASLVLADPVQGPDGTLLGAMTAVLDLTYFQRIVDHFGLGREGLLEVRRTDNGHLLLRHPQDAARLNRGGTGPVMARVAAGQMSGVGDGLLAEDGISRRYAFQVVPGFPLVAIASLSEGDYLAAWRGQALLTGLLLAGLSLLMGWQFLRQRRIQAVLRAANQALRQGDTLLAESEQRFRATFEQAAVGIVHNGFDRRILRVNRKVCEILGYTPEELTGKSYLDFTHGDDATVSDEAVAPLLRGEKTSVSWEKRFLGPTGRVVWGRLTASLQRDAAGVPLHFITVLEDVTQRRQVEAALQAEAVRYQHLLRTASDGIYVVDEAGALCEASESFLAMLGYGAEEARRLNMRDWETAAAAAAIPERIRGFMSDLPCVVETRHRRKDGSVFDVELHVRKVVLEGRRYLYASCRDVSGRKQADAARERAEMELRATGARMRLVLDTAAQGIVGMDDEARIVFANRAAAEMLGWRGTELMLSRPAAEALGHRLADGGSCQSSAGGCAIRATLRDGEVRRVSDEMFCGPDGVTHPVEYVVAPLLVEGIPVGAVVVFHDISERKAMEEDLRRSNAELEQFAYVASHDLRQPLRMISSYLNLIERHLGDSLDPEIKTFFGFAMGGAKRMDMLILDLLEYSRAGRARLPLQPVPLDEVARDAVENLQVAVAEAGAEVTLDGLFPTVRGDRGELVRLFQNLIGNAVKYRLPERPCRVWVRCKAAGGDWLLSVQDNGIGIDAKDYERAFGVFQRLVPKGHYEGTGIGLAVCRKIVEHHHGRIWIESKLGEGSTFLFTLPMLASADPPQVVAVPAG
ncbi:phytochrome-like protein cph1 [mine drainage metagenome]|uniref:histidine kinase n=1 Tax=mine drainage metagenome TaxID=410659 RepID=A0A1J5RUW6_9ZZZZ